MERELFTPREKDILHLVADLHTLAEIASILSISQTTVNVHISNIKYKAHLDTQIQLAKYAIENGYGCHFEARRKGEPCSLVPLVTKKDKRPNKPVVTKWKKKKMQNRLKPVFVPSKGANFARHAI